MRKAHREQKHEKEVAILPTGRRQEVGGRGSHSELKKGGQSKGRVWKMRTLLKKED